LTTFASYQLIVRDINKSISRVENQPLVRRETEYYLANIGKVKSIEEFVSDDRLFRYAMKAHGLEDMAYAKAFMVKALKEGVSDPDSFANRLTDKRYAEFVKAYNFAALGEDATIFNPAQQGTADRYLLAAVQAAVDPDDELLNQQIDYYLENIVKVRSIDEFLADDALYSFALKAFGLADRLGDKDFIRELLEGGVDDPDSLANRQKDKRYAEFVAAFNFARYGPDATTINPALQPTVDAYLRQTLEENAGEQNEGVRLALYFERKAPDIDSFYDVLADRALAQVVRTALGLPEAIARTDIDRQVAMMEARMDIGDFQDPEKLDDFLKRFTSLWEITNPSTSRESSVSVLFGQPAEFGISTDLLLTMAQLKR